MKTIEEVRKAKLDFKNTFYPIFISGGNNLAVGIGKDNQTGEYTIAVRLTNDNLKDTLPQTYKGIKVEVEVIGVVRAL